MGKTMRYRDKTGYWRNRQGTSKKARERRASFSDLAVQRSTGCVFWDLGMWPAPDGKHRTAEGNVVTCSLVALCPSCGERREPMAVTVDGKRVGDGLCCTRCRPRTATLLPVVLDDLDAPAKPGDRERVA